MENAKVVIFEEDFLQIDIEPGYLDEYLGKEKEPVVKGEKEDAKKARMSELGTEKNYKMENAKVMIFEEDLLQIDIEPGCLDEYLEKEKEPVVKGEKEDAKEEVQQLQIDEELKEKVKKEPPEDWKEDEVLKGKKVKKVFINLKHPLMDLVNSTSVNFRSKILHKIGRWDIHEQNPSGRSSKTKNSSTV